MWKFCNVNKYWLKENERRWCICEEEEDTIRHLQENCKETKEWRKGLPSGLREGWDKIMAEEGNLEIRKFFKKIEKEQEKRKKIKVKATVGKG